MEPSKRKRLKKNTCEVANRKDSIPQLEVSALPSRVVSVQRPDEDKSEVMTNGFRLFTFIKKYGEALRAMCMADVPEKTIRIGKRNGEYAWVVLLRRGDPRNAEIIKRLPSKHQGLDVFVDYTSTRPQIRKDDSLHGVISRSSRGRSLTYNIGTVGFIALDYTGTMPFHVIDDGNGGHASICDASGVVVAVPISTNAALDTAVVQYDSSFAERTLGGYRLPIVGEHVYKLRSRQSAHSVGVVESVISNSVRIIEVNNAHSGDSGQLWIAASDGAAVAMHQEGHDLSQGSAMGAPMTLDSFPGLGPASTESDLEESDDEQ